MIFVNCLRRIMLYLVVLFTVSLIIFGACQLLPGDAAKALMGDNHDPAMAAQFRQQMGLNKPAGERYAEWLVGMTHGNWGTSYVTRRPVVDFLIPRLKDTGILAGLAILISIPSALLLGILMARYAGSAIDRALTVTLVALSATPEFLLAAAGVLIFAVKLRWLPSLVTFDSGGGTAKLLVSLIMPVCILAIPITSQVARMTRVAIVNLMKHSYVEMAKLKGVSPMRQILVHAMANTIGALGNVITLNVAYLVSGVVIVETMFAVPGLSQLMINAVSDRDMPVIEACAMVFCGVYIFLLAIADMLGIYFNPRLRTLS